MTIGRGAITERCFGRDHTIVLPPKSDFNEVIKSFFKIAINKDPEKISKISLEKRSRNPNLYYFL